ncbi:helix-turn-helix domain-containing protein [Streptomyces sp. NPDC054884]|uniref:helix-turn-helix domain-containing protein n=1 Tax=Streptomyces sp. ME08-AFT2 TaxID=3028683 RepID=UPI0029A914A8|nr:helix-turn-helix domain-containing protein [Streptomyces sp. ME08-AFT2]MDX3308295.1 helix-turn-helix domain-containing protein [Streptomyces sp. ME08-AFT2]
MDTENPSAPSCAESRNAGKNHPRAGGLTHDNARHTTRFTVIGNHLAQHRQLSLLAIGLGVHIQSLPKGARVDIKSLTARFPEGATRIAAALRELESHGYLRRERSRIPGGRIVTRTVSCNQPGRHDPRPAAAEHAEHAPGAATPGKPKKPRGPSKPLPAVPRPGYPAPALLQAAADLLAGLRRHDPGLLLSACDTAHLAPGVAAWLERNVSPAAVRQALTADLPPEGVRRPAALLAHRLMALLPPPPPFRGPAAPPPAVPHEMRNCDGCDRGIRSPEPGARCRECREQSPTAI